MRAFDLVSRTLTGATLVLLAAAPATAQEAAPEDVPPPCSAPEHSQFDFWLGSWEVFDAEGVLQGTNRIERVLGGCVLHEHWRGAGGSEGRSFNLYNEGTGRWHQTWVDARGGLLRLSGGLAEGSMVLEGREPSRRDPGTEVLHRITWTPLDGGRVRQHWQVSTDDGGAWRTVFDGTYVREGDGSANPAPSGDDPEGAAPAGSRAPSGAASGGTG